MILLFTELWNIDELGFEIIIDLKLRRNFGGLKHFTIWGIYKFKLITLII